MIDSETKTQWSQLLGLGMRGPLKDVELTLLPAVMTDWESWKQDHPGSTVLAMSRTSQAYVRGFYKNPGRFLIGIASGSKAKAWSIDQLLKQQVVNDDFNNRPILAVYDSESKAAFLYGRVLDNKTLSFKKEGKQIVDEQTGSHWSATNGQALSGPLRGRHLTPEIGVMSYRAAWKKFHPKTVYWRSE